MKSDNTGRSNTGYYNTGHNNTGHYNTGYNNTGHNNTGHRNAGYYNTGHSNTGHNNAGSGNAGHWNNGSGNAGHWNIGDHNTGFFNTEDPVQVNVFDSPVDRKDWDEFNKPDFIFFDLTEWVPMSEMTVQEKKDNPDFEKTGGYLRFFDYKEAFQKSYANADEEDRKKILNCPNFDADKFFEISGIDVRVDADKEAKKAELIAKAEELLEQARKM